MIESQGQSDEGMSGGFDNWSYLTCFENDSCKTPRCFEKNGKSDGLKPGVCICIVINFISVGYLILPWAFAQAGSILSSIGFFVIMAQSYITANYVLEACARAQVLNDQMDKSEIALGYSTDSLESGEENYSNCMTDHKPEVLHQVKKTKYEISDLNRVFLGKRPQLLFFSTTAVDLYGITWTFATVFASGFASNLPIQGDNDIDYHLYILIFAAIVVPLSCIDIKDQVLLQIGFLAARLIMVLLMVITVLISWITGEDHFQEESIHEMNHMSPLFNFSSLYIMLQISVFSTAYQFAVPCISSISQDKKSLSSIFVKASFFIFVSSLIMALILANFFGPDLMMQSSNLQWSGYHGGTIREDAESDRIALWAKAISNYIVFFPTVDAIAVFPLLAISLGETVRSAWCGGESCHIKVRFPFPYN